MAKGSQRQRKKNERKKLLQQAGTLNIPKAEKLSFNQLTNSITQAAAEFEAEQRRLERNRKERERRAANKALIDEYGLTGFKPSDGTARIMAAVEKVKAEREKRQRAEVKARNAAMLEAARIKKENWPKGWTKMDEETLTAWIDKYQSGKKSDTSLVFESDVWLTIIWGDRSGNTDPWMFFGNPYYNMLTIDELREAIFDRYHEKGTGKASSGRSGSGVIVYGDEGTGQQFIQAHETMGYQTIFHGNKISHHAFLRYALAFLESVPEGMRKYVIQKLNGYLTAAGYQKYIIEV